MDVALHYSRAAGASTLPASVEVVRQSSRSSPVPVSTQAEGNLPHAGNRRWYVVYTKPHREFAAQKQLETQGFETFLPRYRKTIRHARKLTTVSAAFFPRYLFVALDLGRQAWRSVNGTFGVVSLVMEDVFPKAIPPGVVEALAQASDADCFLHAGNDLQPGDRVRVLSGPFADVVGDLVRLDGARRVQVLLKMLGGTVQVSFDRQALVPVRSI